MMVVDDYVPHALRGIILAGFFAAFMSTIATQLNWGTSYLVEDFYRRFITRGRGERHYVHVSQLVTLLLVIVTGYVAAHLGSIRSGWEDVLQLGAGTGAVYILRWFWWRINAWSEISAMASSLMVTGALELKQPWMWLLGRPTAFTGDATVLFAKNALATTLVTTITWMVVTLLTEKESDEILVSFYRKVRPQVSGWRPVAALAPTFRKRAISGAICAAGFWAARWFTARSLVPASCCCTSGRRAFCFACWPLSAHG
jgi:Na+/proline symporter